MSWTPGHGGKELKISDHNKLRFGRALYVSSPQIFFRGSAGKKPQSGFLFRNVNIAEGKRKLETNHEVAIFVQARDI